MLNAAIATEGTIHIRIGTAGLDHLSRWASDVPPSWSASRDISYGYGRLSLHDSGELLFEYVRTEWVDPVDVDPEEPAGQGRMQSPQYQHRLTGTVDAIRLPPPRVWLGMCGCC